MALNGIEQEYFTNLFQVLTFSQYFDTGKLSRFAYIREAEIDLEKGKGKCNPVEYEHTPEEEYIKKNRCFKRIFQRLCVEKPSTEKVTELIKLPRMYEKFLVDSQISLYNKFAEYIGYDPIKEILLLSTFKDRIMLDMDKDKVAEYHYIKDCYFYYADIERSGVNFIEFIIMVNIYLCTASRDICTLDRKIRTDKDKAAAKKLVERIYENMVSESMRKIYARAIFIVYDDLMREQYLKVAAPHIVDVLPERLRKRKDLVRAYETYVKKTKKNATEPLDFIWSEEKSFDELLQAIKHSVHFQCFDFMDEDLAIAFSIMTFDRNYMCELDTGTKVCEYVIYLEKYIDEAINQARNILLKTYVENTSPLME